MIEPGPNPFEADGVWLKTALHTHTDRTDGDLPPDRHVQHHEWMGFDVVAITDHWTLTTQPSNERILVIQGAELAADPLATFSFSTDAELAIEACGHTGNRPIIRLHLDHGAPLSLPTAISLGDLDHARFLLQEDPLRVHERGPHDFALLWYASIGEGRNRQ